MSNDLKVRLVMLRKKNVDLLRVLHETEKYRTLGASTLCNAINGVSRSVESTALRCECDKIIRSWEQQAGI